MELIGSEGGHQIAKQRGPLADLDVHEGFVQRDPVAPPLLRVVHGRVRFAQYVGHRLGVGVEQGDPDTAARVIGVLADVYRPRQGAAYRFSDGERFCRGFGDRPSEILKQYHEFVAAEAGDDAVAGNHVDEPLGHTAQYGVAHVVPAFVVDVLEPVEVDEEEAGNG